MALPMEKEFERTIQPWMTLKRKFNSWSKVARNCMATSKINIQLNEWWNGKIEIRLENNFLSITYFLIYRKLSFDFVILGLKQCFSPHPDLLQDKGRLGEFQEEAHALLVNQVVMTNYNKKTYTIGGIEMTKNINSPYKSDGTGETFVEYYKRVLFFFYFFPSFFLVQGIQ